MMRLSSCAPCSKLIKLTMLSILLNSANDCSSVGSLSRPCTCISSGEKRRIGLGEVTFEMGGNQIKTFLPSANNILVTHLRQIIRNKNIDELVSIVYFKANTVGIAVKIYKECDSEHTNSLAFSEHNIAYSKSTDHDVVGDKTENSADP
ncbi:hypothetical protein TNCV_643651 [Trichonephila clavipes]|nr:hypothetical protein TNCV_643651 [Trichonephila clavipes]